MFIDGPDAGSIADGIQRTEAQVWVAARIRAHADGFSEARFAERIRQEVDRLRG